MFDINVAGLAEIEGARSPARLACEPVANVFDEARGYGEDRKRPTRCSVTLDYSHNPRGVILNVQDDGPGFADIADSYTLFKSTAKRSEPGVAGRFNCGEKQLIACAKSAVIRSRNKRVTFDGKTRTVGTVKELDGVELEATMNWTMTDMVDAERALMQVIPPEGLTFKVNGKLVERPTPVITVRVSLPTTALTEGVMKATVRKTAVTIYRLADAERKDGELYELGIPVCDLPEFPYRVDVQQKVPLPLSRDMVTPQYAARLIGCIVEQAAMDGTNLLDDRAAGAGYLKDALDWVREPEALKAIIPAVFGDNVVRQTNDAGANAMAAANGATVLPGRYFTSDTRARMDRTEVMPTSTARFGTSEERRAEMEKRPKCPSCQRPM